MFRFERKSEIKKMQKWRRKKKTKTNEKCIYKFQEMENEKKNMSFVSMR